MVREVLGSEWKSTDDPILQQLPDPRIIAGSPLPVFEKAFSEKKKKESCAIC
jgi:hypothetical protein